MAETSSARSAIACALGPQIARGVLVVVACVLGSSTAIAEPELGLSWTAPEACPDRQWATRRVAAQLMREPSGNVAQGVRASVTIEPRSTGFWLHLRTSVAAATGERTIEGSNCQELAEAAALIISLSVSDARESGAAAGPATPRTPPDAPEGALRQAPAFAKHPQKATHVELFAMRADVLIDVGFLDPVGYGPAFALAYQRDVWRAEVAALWIAPQIVAAEDPRAGSVRASLWAVRAGGCALFGTWRIQGGPCVGAEFGQASGAGRGELQRSKPAHRPWIAAFLGARASVSLIARLSWVVQADLVVSVQRPSFVSGVAGDASENQRVHEPSAAELRANTGLELRF